MYRKISNFLVEMVFKSLYPRVNRLSISQSAERSIRNRIAGWRLEFEYRDMARDEEREAKRWIGPRPRLEILMV